MWSCCFLFSTLIASIKSFGIRFCNFDDTDKALFSVHGIINNAFILGAVVFAFLFYSSITPIKVVMMSALVNLKKQLPCPWLQRKTRTEASELLVVIRERLKEAPVITYQQRFGGFERKGWGPNKNSSFKNISQIEFIKFTNFILRHG
jgi:hypothetical protein